WRVPRRLLPLLRRRRMVLARARCRLAVSLPRGGAVPPPRQWIDAGRPSRPLADERLLPSAEPASIRARDRAATQAPYENGRCAVHLGAVSRLATGSCPRPADCA